MKKELKILNIFESIKDKRLDVIFFGGVLGIVTFISVYGIHVLDFQNDGWLSFAPDLQQNYLGWVFYRNSDWKFPIGLFDTLSFPNNMSIIYTDSIPLLAVIFKLFSKWLPETFQYMGLWGCICFALQGSFGVIISMQFFKKRLPCFLAGSLFVFSPILFYKMFRHTALSSHFLILAALALWIYKNRFKKFKQQVICWCVISILASSIHIYLLAMCSGIFCGYLLDEFFDTKEIKKVIFFLISYFGSAAIVIFFILGGGAGVASKNNGLGYLSSNLNSLINSTNFSSINVLPLATSGQYEGYGYLGAGIALMLFVALFLGILLTIKRKVRLNKHKFIYLTVISIFFLVALSPVITLNEKTIIKIPLPQILFDVLSIFRASGRFIWPVAYMLIIIGIFIFSKFYNKIFTNLFLLFILCIQIIEINPYIFNVCPRITHYIKDDYTPLRSPVWKEIAEKCNHIIFLDNTFSILNDTITLYSYADYARQNKMTLNKFYFAREPENMINPLNNDLTESDSLYVLDGNLMAFKNSNLHFYYIDGQIIGLKETLSNVDEITIDQRNMIQVSLTNNLNIVNGSPINEGRILHANGLSYGPYIKLEAGEYRLYITQDGMLDSELNITADKGEYAVEFEYNSKVDNVLTYNFKLDENMENIEFVIQNSKENNIIVKKMILEKIS